MEEIIAKEQPGNEAILNEITIKPLLANLALVVDHTKIQQRLGRSTDVRLS